MLAAAEELGHQANPIAREARTRRSRAVGVLIPDLTNPLFPPIVSIDRRLDDASLPPVAGGDRARARTAIKHLAGPGHGRVAHLTLFQEPRIEPAQVSLEPRLTLRGSTARLPN